MNQAQKALKNVHNAMLKLTTKDEKELATFMLFRQSGGVCSNIPYDLFSKALELIASAGSEEDYGIVRRMASIDVTGIHPSKTSMLFSIDENDLLDLVVGNISEVSAWVKSVKQATDGFELTEIYDNEGEDENYLALNVAHLLQEHTFTYQGASVDDDIIFDVITGKFSVNEATKEIKVTAFNFYDLHRTSKRILITLGRLILKSIASGWFLTKSKQMCAQNTFKPFKLEPVD